MANRHGGEWAAAETADAVCCEGDRQKGALAKRKMQYITCLMCPQVAARRFSMPAAVIERVNATGFTLAAVELCHRSIISPWGIFLMG